MLGGALLVFTVAGGLITTIEIVFTVGGVEIVVYLIRYAAYWHHALILVILLEFLVLKSVLLLSFAVSFHSLGVLTVFVFMAVIAGAAGLGVALIRLMVRACGDDSIRVNL